MLSILYYFYYRANEEEAKTLKSLWTTDECLDSVMKFLSERQKSKI